MPSASAQAPADLGQLASESGSIQADTLAILPQRARASHRLSDPLRRSKADQGGGCFEALTADLVGLAVVARIGLSARAAPSAHDRYKNRYEKLVVQPVRRGAQSGARQRSHYLAR